MITLIPYYSKEEILEGSSCSSGVKGVPDIVEGVFEIDKSKVIDNLRDCLDSFRDDVFAVLEYPYVEKYYRDTYYNFFSKQHRHHERDSFRLSFFLKYNEGASSDGESTIRFDMFSDPNNHTFIRNAYLGFLTIRPTSYRMIGHTFISPKLLKVENRSFVTCLCRKRVFVSGIELEVYGFPFCAQDNESITCAQAVLINLMDYFSNKFPEYQSLLPSQINEILKKQQWERQFPASGLVNSEISFVLKELGFGTIIYSRDDLAFKDDFKSILYRYIESGIPVILHLENRKEEVYHAVLAIGREDILYSNSLGQFKFNIESKKKFDCISNKGRFGSLFSKKKCVDFYDLFSKLLVMDDGSIPYKLIDFDTPMRGGEISSFIVPLYPKIYTEAFKSKEYLMRIIEEMQVNDKTKGCVFIKSGGVNVVRLFLATSRSFKSHMAKMENANPDLRILVIEKSMPKFIWVAEIMTKSSSGYEDEVTGVIILDATDTSESGGLIAAFNTQYLIFKDSFDMDFGIVDREHGNSQGDVFDQTEYFGSKYSIMEIKSKSFCNFVNNLKGVHTLWQS